MPHRISTRAELLVWHRVITPYEPPPSVLNKRGHDRLLAKLIAEHGGGGRQDIAGELVSARV